MSNTCPDLNKQLDQRFVMHTYARQDVVFVSGSGMELVDECGNRYLDFLAGLGVNNLGHCNEAVTEALIQQSKKLQHTSNLYYTQGRGVLAQKLVESVGGGAKVFFSNSGAEANEGAIKLARKWGRLHKPEATSIVTTLGSFHGRTLATVAATGQPERAEIFAPVMPGFQYVSFSDIVALDKALNADTLAFMCEVIQGESGVWPASREYLVHAQKLCHERNILLIIDEVQTGIYRTGSLWAHSAFGINPDIITSAKGLGNGFPIGAVIALDEVASTLVPGEHGSTFGGSNLACAAAFATLVEFEKFNIGGENVSSHVTQTGRYFRDALATVPYIEDVRGMGLMVGATLSDQCPFTAADIKDKLLQAGFIINAIGERHLRFLPPLICENMHIDALISAFYAIMPNSD